MNPEIPSWRDNCTASLEAEVYERMTPEYLAMVKRAAAVTREDLELRSFPIECAANAIA